MKLPKWPWRVPVRVHPKTPPTAGLPGPDARRWAVALVLVVGLGVLLAPHASSWSAAPTWRPWGEPAQRWRDAQKAWASTAEAMTQREKIALDDAHDLQATVDACATGPAVQLDTCLLKAPQPSTALGQLVLVQAWGQAIEAAPTPLRNARLHQGLNALSVLDTLSHEDADGWAGLTRSFQQALDACTATWPGLACAWWASDDEQTWGLSWDRINGLVLPPDDSQVLPGFVRDHRQAWRLLLQQPLPSRSTEPSVHALSRYGQAVSGPSPENPREQARSDTFRERPARTDRFD